MKLKNLYIILILFVSTTTISGQDSKHEVSVYIGSGLSTLTYDTEIGTRDNGFGGNLGIGYTYLFSEYFGLNTGLEVASYNASMKRESFGNVWHSVVDPSDGELYDIHSSVKNYREDQKATYLNIPLMVQFQYGEKNKFYAATGVKIGIPIKGEYKTEISEITNKGYFHDTSNWGEDQSFMAFGTYTDYSNDEDIDLNIAYIYSAELGMKWGLTKKIFLYTGAYLDYGINDIIKGGHNRNLIKLEETSEGFVTRNNSILNSAIGYSANTMTQKLTDKVVPLSIGIKARLAFAL